MGTPLQRAGDYKWSACGGGACFSCMFKRRMGNLKHAPPQHHTPTTPFPYHVAVSHKTVEVQHPGTRNFRVMRPG